MSITHETAVDCRRCGVPVTVFVADSLNAGRHPGLRASLLDGSLHRFRCSRCGHELVVDKQLLYVDHGRGHFFVTYPRSRITDREACLAEARQIYEWSFGNDAPLEVRSLGKDTMVRVCFGLDDLRDKVIADDAGLSDLVLEELKCQIIAEREDLRAQYVIALWLVEVTGDRLVLVTEGPDGTRTSRVAVARTAYDDLAARGHAAILASRPALARGPHVSMLGVLLDS
jgi:hypothetical protein